MCVWGQEIKGQWTYSRACHDDQVAANKDAYIVQGMRDCPTN